MRAQPHYACSKQTAGVFAVC